MREGGEEEEEEGEGRGERERAGGKEEGRQTWAYFGGRLRDSREESSRYRMSDGVSTPTSFTLLVDTLIEGFVFFASVFRCSSVSTRLGSLPSFSIVPPRITLGSH
jgi:hypothetical protein